jgi:hypothetical protein
VHLFADISSHGLGHLAQAAPVLNALRQRLPDLRLTVRSGISRDRLALRLAGDFTHIEAASDFGFVMSNALDIDLIASAARYRQQHNQWQATVKLEATLLQAMEVDAVFSDVAYLPLAGAAAAGIPALAMCSLNWADMFLHYFGDQPWAPPIHAEILAAYRSAPFLRVTPGMTMENLPLRRPIGPIAALARRDREGVARRLGVPAEERWGLVALGGIAHRLPLEEWPRIPDLTWLAPAAWGVKRDDVAAFDAADLPFSEVLAAADFVLTKPGYGTFVEASCLGVPVLYLRRPDWPEEPALLSWLHAHNRAIEISREQAQHGDLAETLNQLQRLPAPPLPAPTGVSNARDALLGLLGVNIPAP